MSAVRPTGDWDGTAFAHEAFVFRTDQELIDRVVPFVLEGLSRGEPVLVVAGERVRTLLAEDLGPDVRRLATFAAAETWWQGGHRTLHAYDRDLRALQAVAPTWRLAAEPTWLARDDGREWSRFEAVANRCYASLPYYSLCLHDRQRLPESVLDAVARTHPLTWGGSGPVPEPAYEDPERFLRSVHPAWVRRPAGASVAAVTTPREARRVASAAAGDWWPARVGDVVPAVHELVVNALRVSAFAEVSSWTDGGTLVVEVADAGPGLPDETLGYVPPPASPDGARGMWLAWSLADDAAVDTHPAGTAVRLFFHR
ncbi:anti-sigma factor RsbA family regulatory protein [Geodermatophilus sp. URMC 61]|uniref:anti-sigma factor RsbA family regulatory protein n=1 Tax=Geodermatophilus sp. URMC 61 TaxID=3423411 RepID=UPI00406D3919